MVVGFPVVVRVGCDKGDPVPGVPKHLTERFGRAAVRSMVRRGTAFEGKVGGLQLAGL